MDKIKSFNEFFDTDQLRDDSGEVDYSGGRIKKIWNKKSNDKSIKKLIDKEVNGFSKQDSDTQNKLISLLRECPFLRSEYFKLSQQGRFFRFNYTNKIRDIKWNLDIFINFDTKEILSGFEVMDKEEDILVESNTKDFENLKELTKYVNIELIPLIKKWGVSMYKITEINPIASEIEELLFSPSSN